MFFSWGSAMDEAKRIRAAGGRVVFQKRWYGYHVSQWSSHL